MAGPETVGLWFLLCDPRSTKSPYSNSDVEKSVSNGLDLVGEKVRQSRDPDRAWDAITSCPVPQSPVGQLLGKALDGPPARGVEGEGSGDDFDLLSDAQIDDYRGSARSTATAVSCRRIPLR